MDRMAGGRFERGEASGEGHAQSWVCWQREQGVMCAKEEGGELRVARG